MIYCQKLDSLGYIYVAKVWSNFNHLNVKGPPPKATDARAGEIIQIHIKIQVYCTCSQKAKNQKAKLSKLTAITQFRVIKGYQFWYQSKPVCDNFY